MTNAEKYLKDNVSVEEILNSFGEMYADNELQKGVLMLGLKNFLETECKTSAPTLSEDERVILRNIKNNKAIGRDEDNCLYFGSKEDGRFFINNTFGHLFQFIKERRRIFY